MFNSSISYVSFKHFDRYINIYYIKVNWSAETWVWSNWFRNQFSFWSGSKNLNISVFQNFSFLFKNTEKQFQLNGVEIDFKSYEAIKDPLFSMENSTPIKITEVYFSNKNIITSVSQRMLHCPVTNFYFFLVSFMLIKSELTKHFSLWKSALAELQQFLETTMVTNFHLLTTKNLQLNELLN